MKMQIGKWGNSLAVRLPRELVEKYGLKEGDSLDAGPFDAALADVQKAVIQERRNAAIKEMEKRAFSLPADYKFDRDDANWRPALDRW